jgi:hypothetical protein
MKKMDKKISLQNTFNLLVGFIIAAAISTGGIYGIPHGFTLGDNSSIILDIKRNTFSLLFLLVLLSQSNTLKVCLSLTSIKILAIFILILTFSASIHQNNFHEYIYRVTSILSIISIIYWFAVVDEAKLQLFFRLLWFFIFLLACYLFFNIVLVYLGDNETHMAFLNGFGGNRPNFSSWLGSIAMMAAFFSTRNQFTQYPETSLKLIFIFLVLATSQVIAGGRIGLLMTYGSILLALPLKNTLTTQKIKIFIIYFAFLGLPKLVDETLQMVYSRTPAESVFRAATSLSIKHYSGSDTDFILNYQYFRHMDVLSGYRLTLIKEAISRLNINNIWLGNGMGNFKIHLGSTDMDVHNLYLRMLGELGLIGFACTVAIVLYPHFLLFKDERVSIHKNLLFIGIIFSMLQPNSLIMGLNACLAYWVIYSLVVRLDYQRSGYSEPRFSGNKLR